MATESRAVTRADMYEAVGWDDRKQLADLFQDYCQLPDGGLSEQFYDAVLACARWGAEQIWECGQ